ncbi:MAG: hypothetical protein JWN44_5559 [Myxococcales bacterium]|nr:hypothetical protein [Myxococcales bacterium]
MRLRMLMGAAALVMGAGCGSSGFGETRMEPAADYGAAERATVSAAPAYTAGPSTERTTSPDGSTTFVCADGSTRPARLVVPGSTPAC